MKKSLLLFFILVSNFCWGQITFQKIIRGHGDEENGHYAVPTNDKGYINLGTTYNDVTGNTDVYLVKIDSVGNILWTKVYGYYGAEEGYSLQQTSDGGYIITGLYDKHYVYLIKTNPYGDTLWTRIFGDVSFSNVGNSVLQTSDGGYIVAGKSTSISSTNANIYLVKTDVNGNLTWTKTFGDSLHDEARCIKQCVDGGYIITGITYTSASYDINLIRTDRNGSILWSKIFRGSNMDEAYSLQITNDGGYIIAGWTDSFGDGNRDALMIKTDSSGNMQWAKCYGGESDEIAYSVLQTNDLGFIVAGTCSSFGSNHAYLIKTDSNGNLIWSKAYEGDDYQSVSIAPIGGYFAFGTETTFTGDSAKFNMVKTDANGSTGCNFDDAATTVTVVNPVIFNWVPLVSSMDIENNPLTYVDTGGTAMTICSSIGINEIGVLKNIFTIYPNPSHNTFTISLNEESGIRNWELGIFDVTGRVVHEQKINSQLSTFNFQLSAGVYFVKVQAGERVYTQKLVVE